MIPKKYYPSIITGFGAAVLSTVPGIKSFSCCLIIPAAAYLALHLYNRTKSEESPIKLNRALSFGLITGLVAALFAIIFDLLITYITHNNDLVSGLQPSEEFLQQFNLGPIMDNSIKIMEGMVKEIEQNGFSALYTVIISISNFLVFSIFGMLGGLLYMSVYNRRQRDRI